MKSPAKAPGFFCFSIVSSAINETDPRSFDDEVSYDSSSIVDEAWEGVKSWENSIADDDWRYHEFDGW
jgi:hypothetical protein